MIIIPVFPFMRLCEICNCFPIKVMAPPFLKSWGSLPVLLINTTP